MKKKICIVFLITFLFSCKKDVKDILFLSSDLEERNLLDNIKSYSKLDAKIRDFDLNQIDEFTTKLKEEFNRNGQVIAIEYFNYSGKSVETTNKHYYENCIKTTYTNKNEILCRTKDTLNNKVIESININDYIRIKIIKEYNEFNLIKRKITIDESQSEKDSTFIVYNYKYDSNNNFTLKEEVTESYTNTYQYKYNLNNKPIEEIEEYEFYRYKKDIKYDDGKIIEISKQSLMAMPYQWQQITGYDKDKNETYYLGYSNFELLTIHKYNYEFDKMGNWIKKITLSSDSLEKQNFKPVYVEIRKIEYWE